MKASLLICIALACIAVSVRAEEAAEKPANKIYGFYIRLPGIYRPPVVVAPSCKNDKTGCPTGETCSAAGVTPPACSTATARTPCAAAADCPASCAAGSCVACQVQC